MEIMQSHEDESFKMSLIQELNLRLEKYLTVLQSAENEGNASKVRRYSRIVKQYKDSISLCEKGKTPPLDELPNPPGFEPLVKNTLDVPEGGGLRRTPNASPNVSPMPSPRPSPRPSPTPPRKQEPSSGNVSVPPIPPRRVSENVFKPSDDTDQTIAPIPIIIDDPGTSESNILDELNSRLTVYKNVLKTAEEENNSSKVRRYNRIIKQYNDAILLHQSGKPVPLDELPNPPGFAPLVPVKSEPPSPTSSRTQNFVKDDMIVDSTESDNNQATNVSPSQPERRLTRADKQTLVLRERQKEYRDAALAAKKAGQINEAKEFLKLCKGFDKLIQASESGLPVDLTSIPVSLKTQKEVEDDFHMVTERDLIEGNNTEIYENLEKELTEQIKQCMVTRSHFKMNGDIANANRFEQFALQFKKDLNNIKVCHSNNYPVPKFHYENKSFSTILCNNDLTDNELELTIIQGINYKVSNPNDVDTYVTYEFPYPSEKPPSGKTSLVKNTNNPCYNAKYVFPIHREVKACQRVFKRHGIKLEVWSKGGFFHSDTLLGTVIVKLMPLNTEINIHDAFDLMNGRRPSGGKLEVKVRVREPIIVKKVESVNEKWLIVDYK